MVEGRPASVIYTSWGRWADRDFTELNQGEYNFIHLGKDNPTQQHNTGVDWLENSFVEENRMGMVKSK